MASVIRMEEKMVRNENYRDKEESWRLTLCLKRLRLYCSGKHLHGSLFYKVTVLTKNSSLSRTFYIWNTWEYEGDPAPWKWHTVSEM